MATARQMRTLLESEKYRSMHPYKTPSGEYVLEKSLDLIDWNYMPHLPEYSVIADLLGTATSEVIAGRKAARDALPLFLFDKEGDVIAKHGDAKFTMGGKISDVPQVPQDTVTDSGNFTLGGRC